MEDNGKWWGKWWKHPGEMMEDHWTMMWKWCENDVKCWECGGETDGDAHFIDEPSTEKRGIVGHLWWGEACANVLNMFTYAKRMGTMMSFNLGTKAEYGIHGFKLTSDNCDSIIVQGCGNLIRINSCNKAFHGFVAFDGPQKVWVPACSSLDAVVEHLELERCRPRKRHVFCDVFFHLELWLGSPAWDKAKPCCRSSCGYNSVVSWKEVGAQQSLGRVSRNAPRSPRSHSFSSFCGSEYVIFHLLIYDFSELKWEYQLFGYTYIFIIHVCPQMMIWNECLQSWQYHSVPISWELPRIIIMMET